MNILKKFLVFFIPIFLFVSNDNLLAMAKHGDSDLMRFNSSSDPSKESNDNFGSDLISLEEVISEKNDYGDEEVLSTHKAIITGCIKIDLRNKTQEEYSNNIKHLYDLLQLLAENQFVDTQERDNYLKILKQFLNNKIEELNNKIEELKYSEFVNFFRTN